MISLNYKKIINLIVFSILIFLFFYRFLISLGAPESIKYILDILNIILVSISFVHEYRHTNVGNTIIFCSIFTLIFGTFSSIVYMIDWNLSLVDFFLDLRLYLRFPILFFSIFLCNHLIDIKKIYKLILAFDIINGIYIIYDYFTVPPDPFGMRGDFLNGFFATERGGNSFVNVVLVSSTIIIFNEIKNKNININRLFSIFILCYNLLIATLIELKAFYFEFLVILIVYTFKYFKALTAKKIFIFIGLICILPFALLIFTRLLYTIYPSMDGVLSIQGMYNTLTDENGYSGANDINRAIFYKQVTNGIFNKNIFKILFGIGIGNAYSGDTMSRFYALYSDIHYTWLTSSYVLIEIGSIGMCSYLLTYIIPIRFITKSSFFYTQCLSILIILILLFFYNETLNTEAAYLIVMMYAFSFNKKYEFKYKINRLNKTKVC